MPHFEDADGQRWVVAFDVAAAKEVRAALDVDLLKIGNDDLFMRLATDPELLVDVLHVLCRQQCQDRGVDPVGFARLLRGDVLDSAVNALMDAVVDFFPSGRRKVLQAAWKKAQLLEQRTIDHSLQMLTSDQMDRRLNQELERMNNLLQTPGGSSMSAPAF